MKNLITKTFAVFTIVLLVVSNAQSQTSSTGNDDRSTESEYRLIQNTPNPFSEVSLVGFSTAGNEYVRITVADEKDNIVEILVEGRVGKGDHFVYFKPSGTLNSRDLRCKMQVMSDSENIIYSEDMIISYIR